MSYPVTRPKICIHTVMIILEQESYGRHFYKEILFDIMKRLSLVDCNVPIIMIVYYINKINYWQI